MAAALRSAQFGQKNVLDCSAANRTKKSEGEEEARKVSVQKQNTFGGYWVEEVPVEVGGSSEPASGVNHGRVNELDPVKKLGENNQQLEHLRNRPGTRTRQPDTRHSKSCSRTTEKNRGELRGTENERTEESGDQRPEVKGQRSTSGCRAVRTASRPAASTETSSRRAAWTWSSPRSGLWGTGPSPGRVWAATLQGRSAGVS